MACPSGRIGTDVSVDLVPALDLGGGEDPLHHHGRGHDGGRRPRVGDGSHIGELRVSGGTGGGKDGEAEGKAGNASAKAGRRGDVCHVGTERLEWWIRRPRRGRARRTRRREREDPTGPDLGQGRVLRRRGDARVGRSTRTVRDPTLLGTISMLKYLSSGARSPNADHEREYRARITTAGTTAAHDPGGIMPKLETQGFHHITMVSTDAPRTLAFYGGLLGLPLVKKTVNFDDPGAYHLYFGDETGAPGTILTFSSGPRPVAASGASVASTTWPWGWPPPRPSSSGSAVWKTRV